eukprot:m.40883 g.40883  ORF g.40883 m.40883 type:complete len:413 (-) comp18640_c1_seq1:165-1403(-)
MGVGLGWMFCLMSMVVGCLCSNTVATNHDHHIPIRPPVPNSTLGHVITTPFTKHQGAGDTWPCTDFNNSLICSPGDIQTYDSYNCGGHSPLSVWRVAGRPDMAQGYSGGFNTMLHSTYCPFDIEQVCASAATGKQVGQSIKPSTLIAINGTLYLGVSCMSYGNTVADPLHRQTNLEAFIAISNDGGVTWDATGALDRQFVGRLAAPMFLQGLENGTNPLLQTHVYAYFPVAGNQSFWNNNDGMLLGRASRKEDFTKVKSWTFFSGSVAVPHWDNNVSMAKLVFSYPNMTGENMVSYSPQLDRYFMANYGFYRGDTNEPWSWFAPVIEGRRWSQLSVFEAPQPWGPWKLLYLEDNWRGPYGAGYTPTFPAPWIKSTGAGSTELIMVHSGSNDDYNFAATSLTIVVPDQSDSNL